MVDAIKMKTTAMGCLVGFAVGVLVGLAISVVNDYQQLDIADPPPGQNSNTSAPEVTLTTLLPNCDPNSGADCSRDEYKKVWARIEADNGEVTKVDMKSVYPNGLGAVTAVVYTYVPGTYFNIQQERRLTFDCSGHYSDISDMGISPIFDAPPRSVAGRVAELVCSKR